MHCKGAVATRTYPCPQWQGLLPAAPESHTANTREKGTIARLLPSGAAGFIQQANSKETLYFLVKNYKGYKADLQPGHKVSYLVASSFDAKRNSPSKAAVDIRKWEG